MKYLHSGIPAPYCPTLHTDLPQITLTMIHLGPLVCSYDPATSWRETFPRVLRTEDGHRTCINGPDGGPPGYGNIGLSSAGIRAGNVNNRASLNQVLRISLHLASGKGNMILSLTSSRCGYVLLGARHVSWKLFSILVANTVDLTKNTFDTFRVMADNH